MLKMRYPQRFWWAALIVAWLVDFLFWGKIPGISIPLWVLVALIAGVFLAVSEGQKIALPSLVLGIVAVVMAYLTFLRAEPMTRFINISVSLCILLLLAATLRSGDWLYYGIKDYFVAAFYLILAVLSRPIEVLTSNSQSSQPEDHPSSWRSLYRRAMPILRGLLLAIPIMLILGALLASADPVFSDWMSNIFRLLDLRRVPEYILRLFFVILPLAYLLCGAYLHAVHPKKQPNHPEPLNPWLKPFLGWTECSVVLVGVNLLFIIFVAIQFRYLFGGEANITETGYTYSEYARRGFGELLIVAILSSLLYMMLGTITKLETRSRRIGFTSLSIFLIGLVIVMLASAFKRLTLYENAYGFTRLRSYTHIFIIWMAILLLAMILMEVLNRRRHFALSIVIFVVGFTITMGVINVDGNIVRQNVQRTMQGETLDAAYLRSLSSDSVPGMIDQYQNPSNSLKVRDQLGLELVCRIAGFLSIQEQEPRSWQSFHLGENIAYNALFHQFSGWEEEYTLRREAFGWSARSNSTQLELGCSTGFDMWD